MKKTLTMMLVLVFLLSVCGCSLPKKHEDKETEISFSFWEPGVSHEIEDALRKVADGYEELHPDVKIRLISESVDSYQDWIKSCVVSDSLPDIESNQGANLLPQYNAGLVVNISHELDCESAYAGGQVWRDTFKDTYLDATYENKFIPFFGVELGMYYNKTIYEELGLEVPQTWNEFINNCEVIKNSGKLPIAFMGQKADACEWLNWDIAGGLFAKKHLSNKNININGDISLSRYETYRALLTGEIDFAKNTEYQQEYREYVKRLKEYLKYCGGYPGLEESIAKAMFLSGEAAHIYTGSWDVYGLMKNSNVGFEVGIFHFPLFTENETPYCGKRIKHLSKQSIAVTKSAYAQEGKLEKVIDFLQYFTSKEVYREFINNTALLPVIEDVECVEGTDVFEYDGYYQDLLLLSDESYGGDELIYDILSGNEPSLDSSFFERMQKNLMEQANNYAAANKLSAENGYYMKENMSEVFKDEG